MSGKELTGEAGVLRKTARRLAASAPRWPSVLTSKTPSRGLREAGEEAMHTESSEPLGGDRKNKQPLSLGQPEGHSH